MAETVKTSFKEKFRSINADKKRFIYLIIICAAIFLGEFIGIGVDIVNTTQFRNGGITEEILKQRRSILFGFLAIYFILVIWGLVEFGHFLRHQKDAFQNEQSLRDSFQTVIMTDQFDSYDYLIQSKPDGLKQVDSTNRMKEVLINSHLFEELLKVESTEIMINADLLNSIKERIPISENTEEILIPIAENPIWDELLQIFPDIFTEQPDNVNLFYAPVESCRIIDDCNSEEDDYLDPMDGITGFFLLTPETKLQFRERWHPIEEEIRIRKNYGIWKKYKTAFGKTPFFIDIRLLSVKISDRTLETAEIKGLTFMTHIALDRDQELEQENKNQEAEMDNFQKIIDIRTDKTLLRAVLNGGIEKTWKEKWEFRKMNAGAWMATIVSFLFGGLLAAVIF